MTVEIFTIGLIILIALVLFVCMFAFKNRILAIMTAIAWAFVGWILLSSYYNTGDMLYNYISAYAGGYISIILAIISLTGVFWIVPKEKVPEVPVETRDDWEIERDETEKRLNRARYFRPKLRHNIYHGTNKK